MTLRMQHVPAQQSGSALVAAMFLVVVVGLLGIFAARLQVNQQQSTTLNVMEHRAALAARAGLEYWSYHVANGGAGLCTATGSLERLIFDGFQVDASCTSVVTGTDSGSVVYMVTAISQSGIFGTPDFVSRSASRQMQSSPAIYD